MKTRFIPCVLAGVFLLGAARMSAQATIGIWTGAGSNNNLTNGANWFGGVAPAPGSDDYFFYSLSDFAVTVDSSQTVDSLYVVTPSIYIYDSYGFHYDDHPFTSPGPVTLSIGAGGLYTDNVIADFGSSISFNLTAAQSWTIGDYYDDPVVINGTITNNGNALTQTGYGTLVLNGSNNLTGTYTLHTGELTVGNNNALGTATLNADYGAALQAAGNITLNNAVSISGELDIDTTRGALTLTGPVTLQAPSATPSLYAYGKNPLTLSGTVNLNSSSIFDIDAPSTVNLSGHVTSSGSGQNLTLYGEGTLLMNGIVDPTAISVYQVEQGKLIFGSAAALPTAANSLLIYGGPGTSEDGYAGLGVSGVSAATFLGTFNQAASGGTIGFDNGITIAGPIDLTGFIYTVGLGSATTATLGATAVITPQGTSYNFGGGGGTLTVAASLTGSNELYLVSPMAQPLTLELNGTNTYTGGTTIDNSVLRFDNPSAFPTTGNFALYSPGSPYFYQGQAYVGFGYNVDLSTPTASSALGSRFTVPAGSNLVIGFDSPGVTVNSNTIDLSGFPTGTFIGTSTSLTLAGTLIAPSGAPLNLAAVKDGHLTVASNLSGSNGLVINLFTNDYFADPNYYSRQELFNYDYLHEYDDGVVNLSDARSTVTLTGNNSGLSGVVTLQGGRLELANNNALGTASLNVLDSSVLAATAPGLNFSNAIDTNGAILGLDSTANDFTLSGPITGYSYVKLGSGTVHVTGDVTANNYLQVETGTLDVSSANFFANDLYVNAGGTVNFHTAAPSLIRLFGDAGGVINLDPGTDLDVGEEGYYAGTIAGAGSLTHSGNGILYLDAVNSYTGGTNISGGPLLANVNGALGPGSVQLSNGELDLGRGVTLTNNLVYTGGTLGGHGTFSPANGPITIGANQALSPGLSSNLYSYNLDAGAINFGVNLTLASGGTYYWSLVDASNVAGAGWSTVNVNGTLTITSTSGSPFLITLYPGGAYFDDYAYVAEFDLSHPYSWTIATASGGIVGFNPANFTLDTSGFGTLFTSYPLAHFDLVENGNSLVLDFDPVPESSTYALMAAGLGVLLVPALRRRRA